MLIQKSNETDFKPVPEGTFTAVCTRFIDIGTQQIVWQGQTKLQRKIVLTWEIVDDEIKMDDGRPFTISQRYTWSMSEKAKLRKDLEAWRGKKFIDADFGQFDTRNLLGKACFLGITHTEKEGKVYSNISSIVALPKSYQAPHAENPLVYFSLEKDRFDGSILNSLSQNLQDTIKASPEYAEVANKSYDHVQDAPHHEDYSEINPPPPEDNPAF